MEKQNLKSISGKLESLLKDTALEIGDIAVTEQVPIDYINNRLYQEVSLMSSVLGQDLSLSNKFSQIKGICYKIIYLSLTVIGLIDKISQKVDPVLHSSGYPLDWGSNSPLDNILSEQAQYHFKRLRKGVNMYDSIKMFITFLADVKYPINSKVEKNIRSFVSNQFVTVGVLKESNAELMLDKVMDHNSTHIH
jgi:hypothetical protein